MAGFLGFLLDSRCDAWSKFQNVLSPESGKESRTITVRASDSSDGASPFFFRVQNHSHGKFANDNIFFENEQICIVLDGFIADLPQWLEREKKANITELFVHLYQTRHLDFLKELRGSFNGLVYDKRTRTLSLFNDPIGSKRVYYRQVAGGIFWGTQLDTFIQMCQTAGCVFTLNTNAAYNILTCGHFLEGDTMFAEAHHQIPGSILEQKDGKIVIRRYHKFNNQTADENISEHDAIEEVDRLFRQAIHRAFEKDREYGYCHCISLSAGYDCRMATWVAHAMGYGHQIINTTMSPTDFWDEITPKAMARYLKHRWIFLSLDHGVHLYDFEHDFRYTGGASLMYIAAFPKIAIPNSGVSHNGMHGGSLATPYSNNPDEWKKPYHRSMWSKVLQSRLQPLSNNEYDNEDLFWIYTAKSPGGSTGPVRSQVHSEWYSPFGDVDYWSFALSLPMRYRRQHYLYKRWIQAKYPDAFQFPHNGVTYQSPGTHKEYCVDAIKQMARTILRPFGVTPKGILNKFRKQEPCLGPYEANSWMQSYWYKQHGSLNPVGYWYETNADLRKFLDNYYRGNIDLLDHYPELKADCVMMYEQHGIVEKMSVLTILATIKVHIGDAIR